MEQCGTAAEETDVTVASAAGDVVVSSVTEKHEVEVQEKTISCDDSLSQVHCEDSTELAVRSPKEDGELSSERCSFQ